MKIFRDCLIFSNLVELYLCIFHNLRFLEISVLAAYFFFFYIFKAMLQHCIYIYISVQVLLEDSFLEADPIRGTKYSTFCSVLLQCPQIYSTIF